MLSQTSICQTRFRNKKSSIETQSENSLDKLDEVSYQYVARWFISFTENCYLLLGKNALHCSLCFLISLLVNEKNREKNYAEQ